MRGRSSRAVLAVLVSVSVATALQARSAATSESEAAVAKPAAPAPNPIAPAAKPTDRNDLFQSLALGSRKEPIHIHSDTLELDYKGSTLTYRGNVQLTQGDVTLTSDTLAITFDRGDKPATRKDVAATASAPAGDPPAGGKVDGGTSAAGATGEATARTASVPGRDDANRIKQVIAEGHVKIRKGERLAEGRRAVFDQGKQTIVLSDGAVLHEGPNQVAGDRIVVYLQEERSVVEGGSNSRVQAVFYPGSAGGAGEAKRAQATGSVAKRDGTPEQR